MRLEDLDFDLPEGLVAQYPSCRRDASRLLAIDRDGGSRRHLLFRQVPDLLRPGDVLVLNRSRVVSARLNGRKARTGGRVQILLLGREKECWLAMARPLRGLAPGDRIDLDGSQDSLEVVERVEDRVRLRLPRRGPRRPRTIPPGSRLSCRCWSGPARSRCLPTSAARASPWTGTATRPSTPVIRDRSPPPRPDCTSRASCWTASGRWEWRWRTSSSTSAPGPSRPSAAPTRGATEWRRSTTACPSRPPRR